MKQFWVVVWWIFISSAHAVWAGDGSPATVYGNPADSRLQLESFAKELKFRVVDRDTCATLLETPFAEFISDSTFFSRDRRYLIAAAARGPKIEVRAVDGGKVIQTIDVPIPIWKNWTVSESAEVGPFALVIRGGDLQRVDIPGGRVKVLHGWKGLLGKKAEIVVASGDGSFSAVSVENWTGSRKVLLIETSSGKLFNSIEISTVPGYYVRKLHLSADGKSLVVEWCYYSLSRSKYIPPIRLQHIDLATHEVHERAFDFSFPSDYEFVGGELTPDGQWVLSHQLDHVVFWNPRTGAVVDKKLAVTTKWPTIEACGDNKTAAVVFGSIGQTVVFLVDIPSGEVRRKIINPEYNYESHPSRYCE